MQITLLNVYFLMLLLLLSNTLYADETTLSTKGGLQISRGDYKFQLGGRIIYDYNKSKKNNTTAEDQFTLRRARIYIKGTIDRNWAFKSQFNVNGDGFEDLYLRYTGWGKKAHLTIGNQRMPFMLEALTSSNDISILQRSAITKRYLISRQEGIALSGSLFGNSAYKISAYLNDAVVGTKTTTATTRVTGFIDTNDNGIQDPGESNTVINVPASTAKITDEKIGFSARYAIAPIKTDNTLIHLGINYRDFHNDDAIATELAGVYGPLHAQAEWANADESGTDADGYYIQIGYTLTGEVRPYKGGTFKRISPNGNFGAWEIVARYEDGDGDYSDIELGRTDATAYSVGINWYAHTNIRFGVNYTEGDSAVNDDDGSEFRMRAQLTF